MAKSPSMDEGRLLSGLAAGRASLRILSLK